MGARNIRIVSILRLAKKHRLAIVHSQNAEMERKRMKKLIIFVGIHILLLKIKAFLNENMMSNFTRSVERSTGTGTHQHNAGNVHFV